MKAILAIAVGATVVAATALVWTGNSKRSFGAPEQPAQKSYPLRNGYAQLIDPHSATAKRTGRAQSLKQQAGEKWKAGDLQSARKLLEEAYRELPESPETPYYLGKVCMQLGDTQAAAEYFRKTFDESDGMGSTLDSNPVALLEYAEAAEAVDRSEAEGVYERIAKAGVDTIGERYPVFASNLSVRAAAHGRLGLSHWKRAEYAEALRHLNKAAGYAPRDPAIAYYRGLALVETGDKTGAKKALALVQSTGSKGVSKTAFEYLKARAEQR